MQIASAAAQLDLSALTIALIVLAGFSAGWIDAVVGGGGLVQLPALLLVPGLSPLQALGTNKLASICGTMTSALTYYRRVPIFERPKLSIAVPMALAALVASSGGAALAAYLPAEYLKPIILGALLLVVIYTAVRPQLGSGESRSHTLAYRKHLLFVLAIGLGVGFYDGILGPGTGSFLIIAMVALVGYSFLAASAQAKIVNLATNFGALIVFIPSGAVNWRLGIPLALANLAGGYLGARMAISKGSGFIRVVFLVVVTGLILRLGYDVIRA